MNTYTVYHETDGVLAKGKAYPTTEGEEVPNLDPALSLLVEVKEPAPSFDSLTQKLKRLPVSYDLVNKIATVLSYEVVELTQEEIDAKLSAHFTSTITNIKYDVSVDSQNAFTRMLMLVNQTQMPDEQELSIKDVVGNSNIITVSAFKNDMMDYGMHCYELFNYVPPAVDPAGMI